MTDTQEVRRQWQAHENDGCAATNTLFAVFGVASPLGRFADNFSFNNTPYSMWLGDISYDAGEPPDEREYGVPLSQQPRSPMADAMRRHGLVARNRRKLAMTPEAHAALLDYYREKLDLLAKIEPIIVAGRTRYRERVRQIHRHADAIRRAIGLIEGEAHDRAA